MATASIDTRRNSKKSKNEINFDFGIRPLKKFGAANFSAELESLYDVWYQSVWYQGVW